MKSAARLLAPATPGRAAIGALAGRAPEVLAAPPAALWESLQAQGLLPDDLPERRLVCGPSDPCGCGGVLLASDDPERWRCSVCRGRPAAVSAVAQTRAQAADLASLGPAAVRTAEALAEEFFDAMRPWQGPAGGPEEPLRAVGWRVLGRHYRALRERPAAAFFEAVATALAPSANMAPRTRWGARGTPEWAMVDGDDGPQLVARRLRRWDARAARRWRKEAAEGARVPRWLSADEYPRVAGRPLAELPDPFLALDALWALGFAVTATARDAVCLAFESPGAPDDGLPDLTEGIPLARRSGVVIVLPDPGGDAGKSSW